jgi:hypothetical protein
MISTADKTSNKLRVKNTKLQGVVLRKSFNFSLERLWEAAKTGDPWKLFQALS